MSPLPKHLLIKREVVSGYIGDEQFQPAGVDLTVEKVFKYKDAGRIDFDNSERKISEVEELGFDDKGYVFLEQGAYKIRFNEIVSIPQDTIALGFPRSSLLRCGAKVDCAVWDPGYKGRSEAMLVVMNPNGLYLKKNGKVAQLVFMKLVEEAKESYKGQYQGENL